MSDDVIHGGLKTAAIISLQTVRDSLQRNMDFANNLNPQSTPGNAYIDGVRDGIRGALDVIDVAIEGVKSMEREGT